MQIIIPMSGIGKRFIDAGYSVPKPLIEMNGKPIIEHVVNMFPGEENFIFICNSMHLAETNMREILNRIAPKGKIVEIPPHKLGPVYAVSQIENLINSDEEVIVNYCDFSCYWDYADFLNHTRKREADGAVPAYRGFHPHMLGTTNYAFMRDDSQWMLEIKEKEPFTDNRMNEFASMGTYYFKKGSYVKKYFKQLMDEKVALNGEYYVSLVYNLLTRDGLKTSIYDVQHMLQWGTPEDVFEYNNWSKYFEDICDMDYNYKLSNDSVMLIPLAGEGSRFSKNGYLDPKPLIDVSGKSMIIQAANCLPKTDESIFVCLDKHLNQYPLRDELSKYYPKCEIVGLDKVTQGQACTCEIGLKNVSSEKALLIAACDNGMVWDSTDFSELVNDPKVDAVVWTFRNHPSSIRSPQMYGWVITDEENNVTGVSVKKAISDTPQNDHAIVGTFFFKKTEYFTDALKRLYSKNIRVNNEFYVDSCIGELVEMGLNVKAFEVDDYICWGTPDDYETYRYWQSFFHKVEWHPYSLEKDPTVNKLKINELDAMYRGFSQSC